MTKEIEIDDIGPQIREVREKYGHIVLNIGMILGLILVTFLGYIYGAAMVCDQVEGILDDSFYCHLNHSLPQDTPRIIIENPIQLNLPNES